MKYLPVYETDNLDFDATYQKLSDPLLSRKYGGRLNSAGKNPDSGGAMDAGSLQFVLYPTQIKIVISPKGPHHRVQVFSWVNEKEKETYLPMLQSLLVPMAGQTIVKLTPLSMNIAGNIPFPGPKTWDLPWCEVKTKYSRVVTGLAGWLGGDWSERRAERKRLEEEQKRITREHSNRVLQAQIDAEREKHEYEGNHDGRLTTAASLEIEERARKKYGL